MTSPCDWGGTKVAGGGIVVHVLVVSLLERVTTSSSGCSSLIGGRGNVDGGNRDGIGIGWKRGADEGNNVSSLLFLLDPELMIFFLLYFYINQRAEVGLLIIRKILELMKWLLY